MMSGHEIIYLDNNATTPLDPAVVEEMLPFLTKYYGNPSSGYAFAATARKAVDVARERLAALVGCAPSDESAAANMSRQAPWNIAPFCAHARTSKNTAAA